MAAIAEGGGEQDAALRHSADVFALRRAHEDELDLLRAALADSEAALAQRNSAAAEAAAVAATAAARLRAELEAEHAAAAAHLRALVDERGRQLATAEAALRSAEAAAATASAEAERDRDARREELARARVESEDRAMRLAADGDARIVAVERLLRAELAAAEQAAREREAALWLRCEALRLGLGDGPPIRLPAPTTPRVTLPPPAGSPPGSARYYDSGGRGGSLAVRPYDPPTPSSGARAGGSERAPSPLGRERTHKYI